MKVKIIALCVAICLVAGLLAACGMYELHDGEEAPSGFSSIEISNENQPKSLQSADSYFIELGDQGNYSFMYDRYTKVMYTQYYSLKSGTTSLTVMLKADGSPLTYNEWKQNVFEEKNE